jgi:hypothetical protein
VAQKQLNEREADFVPVIPTPDQPSMGDAEFVDGQVRLMFEDIRKALLTGPDASNAVIAIAERYAKAFRADNPAYVQTWDTDAQDEFLRRKGYGAGDNRPGDTVLALVAETATRFVAAANDYAEGKIDDAACQFQIDAAAEDCTSALLGLENPQD